MGEKVRVIFYKDETAWIAQVLEHDICVQANTVEELDGRLEVAIRLEGEYGGLDRIGKAPDYFFDLWEKRSGNFQPAKTSSHNVEYGLAA